MAETVVDPVVEPVVPVADPVVVVDPVVDSAVVAAEPAVVDPATPAPVVKNEDWRDARIRVLTARLTEEKSKNQAPQPVVDPAAPANAGLTESQIRERISAEMQAAEQTRVFNQACNDVAQKGKLAFPDFDARVGQLKQLVSDWKDPAQFVPYNQFVAAAIETGDGEKILHALGGDLDEAARIMSLPPIKMAVELTRLASGEGKVEISKAPKPITPIAQRGTQHSQIDPTDVERADKLSTAEWMKRRNEQIEKRGSAR